MKGIDTELINNRNQQREVTIKKGKQAEAMRQEGITLEGLEQEAKKAMGIADDDMIQLLMSSS